MNFMADDADANDTNDADADADADANDADDDDANDDDDDTSREPRNGIREKLLVSVFLAAPDRHFSILVADIVIH